MVEGHETKIIQLTLPETNIAHENPHVSLYNSKGKVGYPWESTRDLYPHIPPIFGLYNGCIGQYGVIFWEQLLGYPPKGRQVGQVAHFR